MSCCRSGRQVFITGAKILGLALFRQHIAWPSSLNQAPQIICSTSSTCERVSSPSFLKNFLPSFLR